MNLELVHIIKSLIPMMVILPLSFIPYQAAWCQLLGQLGFLIDGTREELFEWITVKSIMD